MTRKSDGWRLPLLAVIGPLAATAAVGQPVAEHAEVFLNQDAAVTFTLQASGYEGGPGPVQVDFLSLPIKGTLVEVGFLQYEYTPNPGYYGGDKFRWRIYDGAEISDPATLFLRVNRIPIAFDQSAKTLEQTSIRVTLSGTDDLTSTPHTTTVVQQPLNGTLTQSSVRKYDYLPDPGFHGSDSFQWFVSDGMASSNTATVSLTVNQTPATQPQSFEVLPGTRLANWLDVEDDGIPAPLTFELSPAAHGTVTLIDPAGRFEYTSDPGYSGPDGFYWRASDSVVHSAWELVNLKVQPPRSDALEVGIAFPAAYQGPSFDHAAFNTQHFGTLNVDRLRVNDGNWNRIEVSDGRYDWGSTDTTLLWALQNAYSIYYTIPAKTPSWDCDPTKYNGDSCVPLEMAEFAGFVDALVQHLLAWGIANGGLPIHTIAFGNEWSANTNPVSYPGTKEDYETQQNIVFDTVRQYLPLMPVGLGGLSTGSTRSFAYCKGYLENPEIFSRETYCPQAHPAGIIEKTEYILQNARFDLLDQHLYEFDEDWPDMLTALVNALPLAKRTLPIVASEFGGPAADPGEPSEAFQAAKLDDYFGQLVEMPLSEALFYRLVESGSGSGETYRYSGLIDRDLFEAYVQGGSPAVEKQTYSVFQSRALVINP